MLEQAMAIVDATGEHFHEAEMHRLKGTILLGALDDDECVPACRDEAHAESSLARQW
jgi:hypothetical protein